VNARRRERRRESASATGRDAHYWFGTDALVSDVEIPDRVDTLGPRPFRSCRRLSSWAPLPDWARDTDASDDAYLLGGSVAAKRPMGLAAVCSQARASMLEPISRVVVVGSGDGGLANRVLAQARPE
jgi:hypothetical protein